MTDKSQTEERGVSIPLTSGQVSEVGAPLVRQVRPLADRLRDSVEWLERDGFATSAGLAREAAAELDRLRDVIDAKAAKAEVGAALTARWYMINSFGDATLCLNEANAHGMAKDADEMYSRGHPHRAVQLVEMKQPMTPDQIEAAFAEKVGQRSQSQEPDKWDSGFIWFLSGIRAAERSHGISHQPRQERNDIERSAAQLSLFEQPKDDIEARIQVLLARRRAMGVSGQAGEDIENIRAAFLLLPLPPGLSS